jgi:phosphate transport system protein
MSNHTVSAYDAELKELNDLVVRMGDAVAGQLRAVVGVQRSSDSAGAQRIIGGDAAIDGLQVQIEEKVVQVIARRQPMAIDLRTLIATLKIVTDFERIGDLAKNNAKRVLATAGQTHSAGVAANLERLGRLVCDQVDSARQAYEKRDDDLARAVWMRDSDIDTLQTSMFRELLTYMMEDPRNIGFCTHLMFCARNLERIGDHATNIVEQVHYIVTGKPMPLDRPRGDNISDLPA